MEFNALSDEIQDQFNEVEKCIKKTNQAMVMEKELIHKYNEHLDFDRGSMDVKWYENEKEKLKEIEEAEETAKEIIKVGNMWKYEINQYLGKMNRQT